MTYPALYITIKAALTKAPQHCPYHGQDFEKLGLSYGEPRCESCRQPWRVVRALEAIKLLEREAKTGSP